MGNVVEDYSTLQVSRITDLSLHVLQLWSESGFIIPSVNSGKRGRVGGKQAKRWSLTDVICLKAARDLRHMGVSLQALRKIGEYLQTYGGTFADTFLIATENDVFIQAGKDFCISTLRQPGQTAPCTLIYDLEVAETAVKAKIAQMKQAA